MSPVTAFRQPLGGSESTPPIHNDSVEDNESVDHNASDTRVPAACRARAGRASLTGTVGTVIVGAGHAGLAMSHHLSARSIDHVLLERGEVANSWRHERWDSLRLLTPNWMSSLPGQPYQGPDPHGYLAVQEVIDQFDSYARTIAAPVIPGTLVTAVQAAHHGYRVQTNRGDWRCRSVVIASGACARSQVPALSADLPSALEQLTAKHYRNPAQLAEGGVLVVGASATGLQLAREIQRSGRPVTLAVGEHVRLPRCYRGRDIQWWLHATGVHDERYDAVDDIIRARRLPSPQLAGNPTGGNLDLNALSGEGVRLVGRLVGLRDQTLQFSGSLRNHCALADLKMDRLLSTIDAWIEAAGLTGTLPARDAPEPTRLPPSPTLGLDLRAAGIRTVLWATGFKPDHSWLQLPVFDRKGQLCHEGGVVGMPGAPASGVCAMGLPFMRRRKSGFIHGADHDARHLSAHLSGVLARSRRRDRVALGG